MQLVEDLNQKLPNLFIFQRLGNRKFELEAPLTFFNRACYHCLNFERAFTLPCINDEREKITGCTGRILNPGSVACAISALKIG